MRLLRKHSVDVAAAPWTGWMSFVAPGANERATVLPDGRLGFAAVDGPSIVVPRGAKKIAVRPSLRGVVAWLPDGSLVTTSADGTVRARSAGPHMDLDTLAIDLEERVWLTRIGGSRRELSIELLDDGLRSLGALPLGLYEAQGCDILVDASAELVAVASHYGQDGSLLTIVRRSSEGLAIVETWPSDDDGWTDSFEVDGFHTTDNATYRDSDDAPPARFVVAKLSRAIAVVLCPDLATAIDTSLDDDETCMSARVFGGSLWVTIQKESNPGTYEVRRLDTDSLALRGSFAVQVAEEADHLEVVGDGLVLASSSMNWAVGYDVSLFAIEP